jgi:hypothetical protein
MLGSAAARSHQSSAPVSPYVEPIESCCGPTEEIGLLRTTEALCQQLARIPKHWVAVGALVDREIALKHGARRSERRNASLNVWPPGSCQHLGGWRIGVLVEAKPAEAHAKSAELDPHVLAFSEPLDGRRPAGKNLAPLAAVDTDSDRTAAVIEDNPCIWKFARQVCQLVDLRMIKPGIKGQAEAAKDSDSLAETVVSQQAGRRAVAGLRTDASASP